jgi:RNA polymerase sigma-70 factor, ECF subfamily
MSYPVDKKAQIHSELALLTPRLARFAAALTGGEGACHGLIKATRNQVLARASRERGNTPLVLWAFKLMHGLWASRAKSHGDKHPPADPRLFQPRSSAAGDPVGSARLAKFVAQLSPQQRGILHLVYGERLSYDEVGEIFGLEVSAVMTRLARAHTTLIQRQDHGLIPAAPSAAAPAAADDGQPGRERAA